MFRIIPQRLGSAVTAAVRRHVQRPVSVACVRHGHGSHETDEEFDARYEAIFNNPNIDHWDIRKALSDLQGMDLVPEPHIVIAALKACRRLNDYALSVRFLEAVQDKCGKKVKEIWPYMHEEIKPTLDELGILTPQEMGYDKPELALQSVYDIHG